MWGCKLCGWHRATDNPETLADLTSDIQLSPVSHPAIYRCVFPLGQSETLTKRHQSLSFPVGPAWHKWWGFCTDAEASDLRLCAQLQTDRSHFWHLWTGWPCRKRQTCFWRSELQLIPPHPAARHTRSLLGQFQPFKPSLCPVNRW